ncbi:PP2C family protein-serine/threonine phosphatase [Kitasatospora sp. NBC_00315]|uniref:PP2C family protein-serine/threonine phosphatase n=1 Tax=Kitasatospora sp. NBC_00315 TaxID=2975963 RepID=UPI00325287AB
MSRVGESREGGSGAEGHGAAAFTALLEDSAEDLYDNAPCGYLSTLMDGTLAKVNTTLLKWLGHSREDLVGRRRFADLLTVGGKLYHETHFAPLLAMQGEVGGVALDLKTADGGRLPVLVTSTVKRGSDGQPLLIRTTLFDARDRRAYEMELLRAREEADALRQDAEQARREAELQRQEAERARDQAQAASRLLEVERDRLRVLATTLQRTLLPPALPAVPGLEVAARYHVASTDEVGGDFYDLFPLGGGQWAFFLGDVCGKGAAAAAVTSLARYTLRAAALADSDPGAVLAHLDAVMQNTYTGLDTRFCTVVHGLLTPDPAGQGAGFTLTLASGGHPPALLLHADGTATYRPTPGGQLIGVIPDAHIATTTLHLAPGDTLLLYTDGLTEAHTESDGRYGDEALLVHAARLAPTTASALLDSLVELLAGFGAGVDDDTALVALSVPISRRGPR